MSDPITVTVVLPSPVPTHVFHFCSSGLLYHVSMEDYHFKAKTVPLFSENHPG